MHPGRLATGRRWYHFRPDLSYLTVHIICILLTPLIFCDWAFWTEIDMGRALMLVGYPEWRLM